MIDDRTAVIDVVNRYALAVDTRQWDLLDQVFDTEADIDFGRGARWSNRADLKKAFAAVHADYEATLHVTTNHVVSVQGDTAHCLSYVHGLFVKKTQGGNEFESAGWYDDRLSRRGAAWWITQRTCTMVWSKGNPKVMGAPDVATDPTAVIVLGSLHSAAAAGNIEYLRQLSAI
ncbi:nuclear transport factor 2 family protein [Mycobacterium ahvazicum]|uniref:Nuclear transport factor 2 family protein n=1 Tax=Mycobacterium ahvazicum TaxID=1964395 RepID=A0A2K4YGZ5_9MYCO|nr:nuclear transport factor 2 family protein [Mycobacterium ahvazicum]SOX56066.1 nuclear transport factor 2 family protein [Mycobacterium ahvazicum]